MNAKTTVKKRKAAGLFLEKTMMDLTGCIFASPASETGEKEGYKEKIFLLK
jgi:hypothetical protein